MTVQILSFFLDAVAFVCRQCWDQSSAKSHPCEGFGPAKHWCRSRNGNCRLARGCSSLLKSLAGRGPDAQSRNPWTCVDLSPSLCACELAILLGQVWLTEGCVVRTWFDVSKSRFAWWKKVNSSVTHSDLRHQLRAPIDFSSSFMCSRSRDAPRTMRCKTVFCRSSFRER